jgi:hypothetical protein
MAIGRKPRFQRKSEPAGEAKPVATERQQSTYVGDETYSIPCGDWRMGDEICFERAKYSGYGFSVFDGFEKICGRINSGLEFLEIITADGSKVTVKHETLTATGVFRKPYATPEEEAIRTRKFVVRRPWDKR